MLEQIFQGTDPFGKDRRRNGPNLTHDRAGRRWLRWGSRLELGVCGKIRRVNAWFPSFGPFLSRI